MSHTLIQRLTRIRDELDVARASLGYLEKSWPHRQSETEFEGFVFAQIQRTSANLEVTYIVRLFSTFEAILRDVLPLRSPGRQDKRSAYDLINRAVSKWHISAEICDEAHRIREFRNRIVHENKSVGAAIPFSDALASLNRFLAWLPEPKT